MKKSELRKLVRESVITALREAPSQAGEEAKKRGLKSIGFGRYVDPATGKVVAKSEGGRLVSVKPVAATPQSSIDPQSIKTDKRIDYFRYRIRMAQKKGRDTMPFHKKIAQLRKQQGPEAQGTGGEAPTLQSPDRFSPTHMAPRQGLGDPPVQEPPELDPVAGEPVRDRATPSDIPKTDVRKAGAVIKQLGNLKANSQKAYPETREIWQDIDQTVRGIQAVEGRPEAEEEIGAGLDELEDSIQQLEDVFVDANDKENGSAVRRLMDMMFDV